MADILAAAAPVLVPVPVPKEEAEKKKKKKTVKGAEASCLLNFKDVALWDGIAMPLVQLAGAFGVQNQEKHATKDEDKLSTIEFRNVRPLPRSLAELKSVPEDLVFTHVPDKRWLHSKHASQFEWMYEDISNQTQPQGQTQAQTQAPTQAQMHRYPHLTWSIDSECPLAKMTTARLAVDPVHGVPVGVIFRYQTSADGITKGVPCTCPVAATGFTNFAAEPQYCIVQLIEMPAGSKQYWMWSRVAIDSRGQLAKQWFQPKMPSRKPGVSETEHRRQCTDASNRGHPVTHVLPQHWATISTELMPYAPNSPRGDSVDLMYHRITERFRDYSTWSTIVSLNWDCPKRMRLVADLELKSDLLGCDAEGYRSSLVPELAHRWRINVSALLRNRVASSALKRLMRFTRTSTTDIDSANEALYEHIGGGPGMLTSDLGTWIRESEERCKKEPLMKTLSDLQYECVSENPPCYINWGAGGIVSETMTLTSLTSSMIKLPPGGFVALAPEKWKQALASLSKTLASCVKKEDCPPVTIFILPTVERDATECVSVLAMAAAAAPLNVVSIFDPHLVTPIEAGINLKIQDKDLKESSAWYICISLWQYKALMRQARTADRYARITMPGEYYLHELNVVRCVSLVALFQENKRKAGHLIDRLSDQVAHWVCVPSDMRLVDISDASTASTTEKCNNLLETLFGNHHHPQSSNVPDSARLLRDTVHIYKSRELGRLAYAKARSHHHSLCSAGDVAHVMRNVPRVMFV